MKKLFLIAIVVLGFAVASFGQSSVTTAVSTSVTIISPLTVSKTGNLVFGSVIPGLAGGNVVITAEATPTLTPDGTVNCIGTFSNVKFSVAGEANTTYSVTYPATVSLTGGGPAMTATLSCSAAATANPIATADFYVGASLAIGTAAAQTAGNYTGTFNVIVAYE